MLKLQFKDHRQSAIWLSDERFTIGQDPSNTLALNDRGIAAFHGEIRREGNLYFIADAGATGILVNGERISSRYQLRPGDTIKFGNVEFELISPLPTSIPEQAKQDWSIQAIKGTLKGQRFPISGSMTLGRSNTCEIHIDDERISRRHSELHVKDGILRLKDLGSANGTIVNHKPVKDVALVSGDQIQFDAVTFLVIGPAKVEATHDEDDDEATVFSAKPLETPAKVASVTKLPNRSPAKPSANTSTHDHTAPLIAEVKKTGVPIKLVAGAVALIALATIVAYGLMR